MLNKYLCLIMICLTAAAMAFAQSTFKPRDADEAEGWQIYNQYKASRAAEVAATQQIKQAIGDVASSSLSTIGLFGSDPSDRARLIALRQTVDAERQKQAQLLARWGDKFYWRYGDLAWADDKIIDPGTKREMDRIEFALTYFPFDPKKANTAAPAGGPSAGTWRPEGPWNGMQIKYSISGVNVTSTEEGGPFCCWIRTLKGDIPASGTIRVTGSVGMVSGLSAGAVVSVRSGNASKEWRGEVDPKNKTWDSFDVSIVIPQGATSASISISMEGRYGSAAAGESRGVSLVGTFSRPTGAPPPTPAPTPTSANTKPAIALAGTWGCSDGGTYQIKQSGTSITWEAASADGGKTWSHTFVGTIQGDKIVGRFEDRPPGQYRNRGELTLRIVGGSKLEYFSSSVPFGGRVWNR